MQISIDMHGPIYDRQIISCSWNMEKMVRRLWEMWEVVGLGPNCGIIKGRTENLEFDITGNRPKPE